MLKKVLSIFFTLCLVFSLTVPCFAQDIGRPVYYNQLFNDFDSFFVPAGSTAELIDFGSYYRVTFNGIQQSNGIWSIPSNRTAFSTDRYYIQLVYVDNYSSDFTLSVRFGNSASKNFSFVSDTVMCTLYSFNNFSGNGTVQLQTRDTVPETFDLLGYNIVDLSAIYDNPSSVTVQQFLEDFPFFLDSPSSFTKQTYFNPSVTDGFGKMLNISHVFDRIPYFFDQYTTVTVWIVGSVSLSIVILVIVFMIKRFSGGKS